jgi:hypothetical protein
VHFTVFGQGWFHENFDKGASAYLGETLTYTASRNCDIHCETLIQMDLPGIGNYQVTANGEDTPANEAVEILHPHSQLGPRYSEASGVAAGTRKYYVTEASVDHTDAASNFVRTRSGQPHYCDGVALAAVKWAEYMLGGQRMDRHDKHTLYTWHLLNNVNIPYKMLGLAESRAHHDIELKLDSMAFQRKYCPLVFSFCRHPAMAIPLISNMYNNLSIQCELEPFSALIKNYSGAGNNGAQSTSSVQLNAATTPTGFGAISDNIQFFTMKRKHEETLTASRARGRDLRTANLNGFGTDALAATDLAQANFPVAVVSRVFFLGPQERYAFASNAHCQVVEACQRVKHSITQQSSYTFRTDTLQNACSVMYVCPIYKPNKAANEHFDYGGVYDHIRDRSFPALTTLQFTTNGADLYAEADESFFRLVQPYVHHANVAGGDRKIYPMNFGSKVNGKGAVQYMSAVNLSRSVNSQATLGFASNLWAYNSDADDQATIANGTPATSTTLEVEFVVWNYNVLCYRGGIGGYVILHVLCNLFHCIVCVLCKGVDSHMMYRYFGIIGISSPRRTTQSKEATWTRLDPTTPTDEQCVVVLRLHIFIKDDDFVCFVHKCRQFLASSVDTIAQPIRTHSKPIL